MSPYTSTYPMQFASKSRLKEQNLKSSSYRYRQNRTPAESLIQGEVRTPLDEKMSRIIVTVKRRVPATSAPFPFREHPDTPTSAVLILAAGVFSSASIIRRTAHAHAIIAPDHKQESKPVRTDQEELNLQRRRSHRDYKIALDLDWQQCLGRPFVHC